MTRARRALLIALSVALLAPAAASQAEQKSSWIGAWRGLLGKASAISVTINKNGAIAYVFRGAKMPIAYSRVTDNSVSFGDRDDYSMTLTQTGPNVVTATYHGRNGYATAVLRKR